jgi:hypothetical protein
MTLRCEASIRKRGRIPSDTATTMAIFAAQGPMPAGPPTPAMRKEWKAHCDAVERSFAVPWDPDAPLWGNDAAGQEAEAHFGPEICKKDAQRVIDYAIHLRRNASTEAWIAETQAANKREREANMAIDAANRKPSKRAQRKANAA